MSASTLLLLVVGKPTLEYDGEVQEDNKAQAASLESIVLEKLKDL